MYQRALPGASIKSLALGAVSTSANALGQASLLRELTRHVDCEPGVGDATLSATKAPGLTPDTFTPK